MIPVEHELDLLEHIARGAGAVHQRDLARTAGLSLGMTNAVLKRLAQKGWLSIRKINNRNIRYIVSPAGVEQIADRSFSYFKRTLRNIVEYREGIEQFVRETRSHGYAGVVLVGGSDLDFIVEHACRENGMKFICDHSIAASAAHGERGLFLLYSESYLPDRNPDAVPHASAFLHKILRITPSGRSVIRGG
jgi:DNA-binding MarR family transcriptional regulator